MSNRKLKKQTVIPLSAARVVPPEGRVSSTEPAVEVVARPRVRTFTADYKRWVVSEADKCVTPGSVGAFLRQEGLYSSELSNWRKQLEQAQRQALTPKTPGRKANEHRELNREQEKLKRENARLKKRLAQAETLLAIQKKVSELLGIVLPEQEENEP